MTHLKPKSTKNSGVFLPAPSALLLSRHLIATLPDSIAARRGLLNVLLELVPLDSVEGDHAALLGHTLHMHTLISTRGCK